VLRAPVSGNSVAREFFSSQHRDVPKSHGMLLVTLLAVAFTVIVAGVFVYAIVTAANGREDENGFHYVGNASENAENSAIRAHAPVARS
jgi:hypothetical protein